MLPLGHGIHPQAGGKTPFHLIDEVVRVTVSYHDTDIEPAEYGRARGSFEGTLLHTYHLFPSAQNEFLKLLLC